jgi:hypothetical protein
MLAMKDAELDRLRSHHVKMFPRVIDELGDALHAALTLVRAYDYYIARCTEAGIPPKDAAVAWNIHSSEAFERELVEAESYGPNALRLVDTQILAKLGIAPHEATKEDAEDEEED